MDFLTGTDVSLNIIFEANGQTLVPDTGSVKLNLRNHEGTLLITNQTVTVGSGLTSASVLIGASHNTLTVDQKFARRVAQITFTSGGQTYNIYKTYRVNAWLNHDVTPETVRGLLGVNVNDLPDSSIDILKAYLLVELQLSEYAIDINDKLIAGDIGAINTNKTIACSAALDCLASLRLGVAQQEENGALSFSRFASIDWDALEASIRCQLEEAFEQVVDEETTSPTLIVFTTRTDPITGV